MAEMNVKIEPARRPLVPRPRNNTGHLWGHVQVIKPPKLLELVGPMFMSYAATSHVQYRVTEKATTAPTVIHQAIGLIPDEHMTGVHKGWEEILATIRAAAEAKLRK